MRLHTGCPKIGDRYAHCIQHVTSINHREFQYGQLFSYFSLYYNPGVCY